MISSCSAENVCGIVFYLTFQSPGPGRDHWANVACPEPWIIPRGLCLSVGDHGAGLCRRVPSHLTRQLGRGKALGESLGRAEMAEESGIIKLEKGAKPKPQALGQALSTQL